MARYEFGNGYASSSRIIERPIALPLDYPDPLTARKTITARQSPAVTQSAPDERFICSVLARRAAVRVEHLFDGGDYAIVAGGVGDGTTDECHAPQQIGTADWLYCSGEPRLVVGMHRRPTTRLINNFIYPLHSAS